MEKVLNFISNFFTQYSQKNPIIVSLGIIVLSSIIIPILITIILALSLILSFIFPLSFHEISFILIAAVSCISFIFMVVLYA